jgi:hypothetical protein
VDPSGFEIGKNKESNVFPEVRCLGAVFLRVYLSFFSWSLDKVLGFVYTYPSFLQYPNKHISYHIQGEQQMKNLLLAVVLLALVVGFGNSSSAGPISLSVGGDVLMPMGTFGDAYSMGFGGSVRGQYKINPMFSAGLTVGYYTWSGKDVNGFKAPTLSGIPIRAYGLYYFMPESEKMRVYGMFELGMFMASTGDITYPNPAAAVPGQPANITVAGGSSSDFNYAPGVGIEFPLGSGSSKLDVSVRYDAVSATGGTNGSFAARVGVNFGLGD